MKTRLLCQHCEQIEHQDMLTTYCLRGLACDRCKRVADTAMTVAPGAYARWVEDKRGEVTL